MCIPPDEGKALMKYLHSTQETRKALAGCPLVRTVE